MKSMRRNKSVFEKKKIFLRIQEKNDKMLFKKIIIERSVSPLRQYHVIIFKQYYLFDI